MGCIFSSKDIVEEEGPQLCREPPLPPTDYDLLMALFQVDGILEAMEDRKEE